MRFLSIIFFIAQVHVLWSNLFWYPVVAADVSLPNVLEALPIHEWRAVSGNTIKDVDFCPKSRCAWSAVEGLSGVVNDWTGGVYASKEGPLGGLVYFGGGHNGYYGNEVYFFNLATLKWERRGDPTDGKTPGDINTFGLNSECRFWDGKPPAIHTYDSTFYDPQQNRFWLPKVGNVPSSPPGTRSGCRSPQPASFSLSDDTWRFSRATTPLMNAKYPGIASAFDHKRQVAWMYDRQRLHSYDPVADRWQTHAKGSMLGLDTTAAIDPGRDLLVITDFKSGRVVAFDLTMPDRTWFEIKTTGDTVIQTPKNVGNGFEWAPQLGGFICYKSGRSLYLLMPPKGNPRREMWMWTRIEAKGVIPDQPKNGPFSKFQYIPQLGIAFVANSVTGPVFAVRLARGTITKRP